MSKTYSIAQARQNLPAVVHEAERAGEVRITRRGEVVARLVAESEFQRLTRRKGPIDWGARLVSLRGFRFDRDEANAR
ncbi:MAG: type II toxin-antitoxin system Phd/YefM family antitoxin [Proteobacteria bacterium]|jgi:prevent-host-death family protein|nr:type II toxin-antitoxin system Phd/YefM family antitoxin [Pseudomonadota bacterium]